MTRREFLKTTALTTVAMPMVGRMPAAHAAPDDTTSVALRWLDGRPAGSAPGATWGVPWKRGERTPATVFSLRTPTGEPVPLQSWPLATWPDGSLKWSAHALPGNVAPTEAFELWPGRDATVPPHPLTATESEESIEIDTGIIRVRLPKKGSVLLASIHRENQEVARDGRLVCLRQDRLEPEGNAELKQEAFHSEIGSVQLEQKGPVRAVVKIEGKHQNDAGRAWLPFTVRLYFYAGTEAVRMLHTVIYDGDEKTDFIRGLGVRFTVPLRGELYDRHVRFGGEADGLFGEAVRGLTGLRHDLNQAITSAQVAGTAVPRDALPEKTLDRLQLVPAFGDWTLCQLNSDAFEIRKRTKEGLTWLPPGAGRRAAGLGYIGSPQGGLAFGIRNFWQSHPAQLDIRGATGEAAEATAWLWAPDARPMDMRFYHDGMGEDDYAKQIEGLEITYEDYEPGFERPFGVARTSELYFWPVPATPARERFGALAEFLRRPPVLMCTPAYLQAAGTFGGTWQVADRSTPAKTAIEDKLDWLADFYAQEVEQRRWFGFWDFGDVMHTYDRDRHVWRYDVGGFAWDNTELSTEIWFWLHFLRNGTGDAFRFAEAMTRHTGEVDVHHVGPFAPLGSRHNVRHWGDSAKQMRISTVQNKRYFYYLTGDERTGDLMHAQLAALRTLIRIQPNRKQGGHGIPKPPDLNATHTKVSFGTDWGALSAAWLAEWERTGDAAVRQKLENSMRTIGAQEHGFFTGASEMNLETGEFKIAQQVPPNALHLSAVFGQVEVCAELVDLLKVPEFDAAWLQYCELYNAPPAEQERILGGPLGKLNLEQGHARLTAFAAHRKGDAALARRAWTEFYQGGAGIRPGQAFTTRHVEGSAVLAPIDEAAWLSTNAAAQWGLAAIECLAWVGKEIPAP